MNHSIATVIHFCTNEIRFLAKVVEEAKHFSQKIVIPICDHFFNGAPEKRAQLDAVYRAFPDCQFIEFAFYPDRFYHPGLRSFTLADREAGFFWHSTARYVGQLYLPADIEHVLFLDADEVIDGQRFKRWLDRGEYLAYSALRLRCYVYVQRASLRSSHWFNSALFARIDALDSLQLIHAQDRHGAFERYPAPKRADLVDEAGPFIHHYPWVRTEEECLHKADTWGHRFDKEWKGAIERMFRDEGRMDLAGAFEEVEPYFDPLQAPPLVARGDGTNVFKVDEPMARRREIERLL